MKRKIGFEVREFQQLLNRRIEKQRDASAYALTHTQTRVLLFVSQSKQAVFQKDIEKELDIRRSTATEMLSILERDGLIIRRHVSYDARLKEITLTDKSKSFLSEMKANIRQTEAILRENIDPENLEIFFVVLDQIKENLR